jgi:glycosyltransferase involved in cell wall biosynthesis
MLTKKVAIIHDWMNGFRGGEQVLDALVEIFPQAEIFTLFYTPGTLNARIENRPIHVSFLNKLPGAKRFYRYYLPLFPMAIERFDLSQFDLVISSSHCVAKGVIPHPKALHLCYCHTPMRYSWDRYQDYFGHSKVEPLLFPFIHYLRIWDVSASHRVDHFIANSNWVRRRIERFYRRDADVIYPPLSLDKFSVAAGDKGDYYLIVAAFAPYKRIDIAIEACEKLDRRLLIVGAGQDEKKLRGLAKGRTEFLGKVAHEDLKDLLGGARAFLHPGEEDFGIAPLEAMAAGTPVIAFGSGGALETVVPNETGIFFREQTVESLSEAILNFEKENFSKEACRRQAERFSRERFLNEFREMTERQLRKNHRQDALDSSPKNFPIPGSRDSASSPLDI